MTVIYQSQANFHSMSNLVKSSHLIKLKFHHQIPSTITNPNLATLMHLDLNILPTEISLHSTKR